METVVKYRTSKGRASSGEAIGILLLDTAVPFIPGDVANASTYDYPVRFQKVEGFTVARAIGLDSSIYPSLHKAAVDLVSQGVRGVTGDCGFMALHQEQLAQELAVPVFLSSLLQLPFILSIIGPRHRVGILTANGPSLADNLLDALGFADQSRLVIEGLEHYPQFAGFAIEESGELESDLLEMEIVAAGKKIVRENSDVAALLVECSLLPPYSRALQEAVGLPVFDYITMIDFVFSAVVKKRFTGFI